MTPSIPHGYARCPMPDGGFATIVGPLLMRRTDTGLRFAFQATDKHTNARGVLHGGMLLTFADQVLGLTVQSVVGTLNVATVSLNCDLVSAAFPGDFIEGEATVSRAARTLIFVKGTLTRGETVIMNASGLWTRLPAKDKA